MIPTEKYNIVRSGGYERSKTYNPSFMLRHILNTEANYIFPVLNGLITECSFYKELKRVAELEEALNLLEFTKDSIESKVSGGRITFIHPQPNKSKTKLWTEDPTTHEVVIIK